MDRILKGRYHLLNELGQGGMGIVYHAHDALLDREVAVKLLTDSSNTRMGSEGRARLLHEAQSAARLNHPNIVSIFDAGDQDGESYIVMELIQGHSLHTHRPQTIPEILAVGRQICAGLEHAHSHGVIHRDLKPENILVTDRGVAKLTDFGLARSVTSRLTLDGMIVGTVLYLAPEAALRQPFDGRSDLYSLGVILYELAAGCLPFTANDPLAVISQHLYAPVTPPRVHRPEIPADLDRLIVRLLSKRPEERPASAAEVGSALEIMENLLRMQAESPQGLPAADEPSRLERLGRGHLVGRERELAEVQAAWRSAASGEGSVLLISGEPGIGKSRLARELVAHAFVSGGRVLTGACYSEGGVPYAPFPSIIQSVIEFPGFDLQLPPGVAGDLVKVAPDLHMHLAGQLQAPAADPIYEQQHIFESVVTFFGLLSGRAPLLIFIDDANWADRGTLSLLRRLARRARQMRLLIALTYREIDLEEGGAFQALLNDLVRDRLGTRLKLTRLDRAQTEELLKAMLTPKANLDERMVDAIYTETEGNPFFIEEVTKALLEAGTLCLDESCWRVPDANEIVIPQSVHAAIQSRLGRLEPRIQEVLRAASILGRWFEYAVLRQTVGVDEDTVVEALEIAERAQILTEAPGRGSGLSYAFAHGLIRATLRDSLSGVRRQRLHQAAAEAVKALHPENPAAMAYHYAKAGDGERARVAYTQAADRALAIFANQEAERYYKAAIELDDRREDRVYLLNGLAEALFRQAYYADACQHWQEAAELKRLSGDLENYAHLAAHASRAAGFAGNPSQSLEICQKALGFIPGYMELETPGVATLVHETARAYRFLNRDEESMPICRHALDMARRLNLVEVQAEALATLGILRNQPVEDGQAALEEAVRLSDANGLMASALRAHVNLGELYRWSGQFSNAQREFRRTYEVARQMGLAQWEHDQLVALAEIAFDLSQFDTVAPLVEEIRSVWPRLHDTRLPQLAVRTVEARLLRFQGDWEKAAVELRACLDEAVRRKLYWMAAGLMSTLGDLLLEMGRLEDAGQVLSLEFAPEEISPIDMIMPRLMRGVMNFHQGDMEAGRKQIAEARPVVERFRTATGAALVMYAEIHQALTEQDLETALARFAALAQSTEHLGARWWQARLNREWALALAGRGAPDDREQAAGLFRKAAKLFTELKMPLYAARCDEGLSRL